MILDIDGKRIETPRETDIAAGIPDSAPTEAWGIELKRSETDSIEADGTSDGTFALARVSGQRMYDADRTFTGEELRQIFILYLKGDPGWQKGFALVPWDSSKAAVPAGKTLAGAPKRIGKTAEPPAGGKVARSALNFGKHTSTRSRPVPEAFFAFLVVLLLLFAYTPRSIFDPFAIPLPRGLDSEPARVILFFFAFVFIAVGGIAFFAGRQDARTKKWPSVAGRILRSEEVPENEGRSAGITYQYVVGDTTYRASRITGAENTDPEEAAAQRARYRPGAAVQVFYNPDDPAEALLEPGLPKEVLKGCLIGLAFGALAVAVLMKLVTIGPAFLSCAYWQGSWEAGIPTALLGALFLGIFLFIRRRIMAARRWPTTTGKVLRSTAVRYHTAKLRGPPSGSTARAWKPFVEYEYSVHGRTLRSRQILHEQEVGGSEAYARKIAAQYPAGRVVNVHYDPNKPERTCLDARMHPLAWVLAVFGVLFFIATFFLAGFSL